jgi:hypothetical protein
MPWAARRRRRPVVVAERHRPALDLHDSVCQTLVGLQITAKAAVKLWDTQTARARAALETVRSLAAGAAAELRAVLLDLHDPVRERQGGAGGYPWDMRRRSSAWCGRRWPTWSSTLGPAAPRSRWSSIRFCTFASRTTE